MINSEKLQEILKSGRVPSSPVILESLTRALADPDTSLSDLARCLLADQGLTVKILRVVNSSYFGLPKEILSVQEAVFRLGFQELWSLAVGLQMADVFKEAALLPAGDADSLWEHSLKVGIAARRISHATKIEPPEEFFTAGVIHDIGKLVFFCYDPKKAQEIYSQPQLIGPALMEAETRVWGINHAELGGHLVRHWNLPDNMAQLVERHHSCIREGAMDSRAAVLVLGDAFAHAAKIDPGSKEGSVVRLVFPDGLVPSGVLEKLELEVSDCIRIATETMRSFEEFVRALP